MLLLQQHDINAASTLTSYGMAAMNDKLQTSTSLYPLLTIIKVARWTSPLEGWGGLLGGWDGGIEEGGELMTGEDAAVFVFSFQVPKQGVDCACCWGWGDAVAG